MDKPKRTRLQLSRITVRILDIYPERVRAGNIKTNATQADACSHTCTCTDTSIWPCRQ